MLFFSYLRTLLTKKILSPYQELSRHIDQLGESFMVKPEYVVTSLENLISLFGTMLRRQVTFQKLTGILCTTFFAEKALKLLMMCPLWSTLNILFT